MRYVCSFCHTRFEAEPAPYHVCPNCKAEEGIEVIVSEPPMPMRYFGMILLIVAILTLGGVVAGVMS
jgi:hypothetical protein